MALNKAALEAGILSLMQGGSGKPAAQAQEEFAEEMANLIDSFVKSGTVNTVVATPDTFAGTGVGAVT